MPHIPLLIGTVAVCLLAFTMGRAPGTGMDDPDWIYRTPLRTSLSRLFAGLGFALGGLWIWLYDDLMPSVWEKVFGGTLMVFSLGIVVYMAATLLRPAHAPTAIGADDTGLRVYDGLRPELAVDWDHVTSIYTEGEGPNARLDIKYVDAAGEDRLFSRPQYAFGGDPKVIAEKLLARGLSR